MFQASAIDVVGFHGQTIWHRPERRRTLQIGDGERLAEVTGISVVDDFRSADVAAGGQGRRWSPSTMRLSPRAGEAACRPQYRRRRQPHLDRAGGDGSVLAFDTGPGNALIDDWVWAKTGWAFDEAGRLAASGRADDERIRTWLRHDFFRRLPPKSLDRDDFRFALDAIEGMSLAAGAATLPAFTGRAVASALQLLPAPPVRWIVCGGGRYNPVLLETIHAGVGAPVDPVEAVGWRETSWKRRLSPTSQSALCAGCR